MPTAVDEKLAERLRRARRMAGFHSASDAARALVERSVVEAIPTYLSHENATRGIPRARAVRYASAFKVSLAWLLTGMGPPGDDEADTVEPALPASSDGTAKPSEFFESTAKMLATFSVDDRVKLMQRAAEISEARPIPPDNER